MTQPQIIERFVGHLQFALSNDHIDSLYYGLSYWEQTDHYLEFVNIENREAIQQYLQRYHERVFCYELYHKLRVIMDQQLDDNNAAVYASRHIYLQSEVRKTQIHELVENVFGVVRLSAEYMPDFLLHTPGNFDNQLIVMEVKSNPRLSLGLLMEDLLKIQEFISNYHYLKGIFIAVNIDDERRTRLINALSKLEPEVFASPGRITLFFKDRPDSPLHEFTLNNLPA